jgi:hypothetical protein
MFSSDRRFPNLTRVPRPVEWFALSICQRVHGLNAAFDRRSGDIFFFYGEDASLGVFRQKAVMPDGEFVSRSRLDEQVDGVCRAIQSARADWREKQRVLDRQEAEYRDRHERQNRSKMDDMRSDSLDYARHVKKKTQMGKHFKGMVTVPGSI